MKKIAIVIIVLLVLAVVAFVLYKNFGKKNDSEKNLEKTKERFGKIFNVEAKRVEGMKKG